MQDMLDVNYPTYVAVIVDTGCVFGVNAAIYIEEATISQNSQENTCARISFLIKWQAWSLQRY